MSSSKIFAVKSYEIDKVWGKIKPLIYETLRYADGKYTVEKIKGCLNRKEMQLWLAGLNEKDIDAYAITQVVNYPSKCVLLILFAAGKASDNWLHFIEDLKKYAQLQGCSAIEIYGRKGWEKKLKPFGYECIHQVYRLELVGA